MQRRSQTHLCDVAVKSHPSFPITFQPLYSRIELSRHKRLCGMTFSIRCPFGLCCTSQTGNGSEPTWANSVAGKWRLAFHLTALNPRFFIKECPQSIFLLHNDPEKVWGRWGQRRPPANSSNSQKIPERELTRWQSTDRLSFLHVHLCIPPLHSLLCLSSLRCCITGAAGPSHTHRLKDTNLRTWEPQLNSILTFN